ncbi:MULTISPECIES: TPM domain-containing protein [unclassified Paraburkholderia]|uniref:TPM domain-containing protein n=1 Tax=unclassified Paraburkholderia TaxID=2615204 RepID=UPI002AAF5CD5|nr:MULTISPECIES: TPM domain-containing protein [unclassified Paraburkholderia]
MYRWGWLAALLVCAGVHAADVADASSINENATNTSSTEVTSQDAMASANVCNHADLGADPRPAVDASALQHPQDRVTDLTGALSDVCKADLIARLARLEQRTGVQLAVLLVPSTDNDTIEQYATKIFEQWRLGQQIIDNGMLLLVSLNDRHVRIEVGYGLEGTITDLTASRIIRQRIVPEFRMWNYEAGVSAAVDDLALRLGDTSARPPALPLVEHLGVTLFWTAFILANMAFGTIAAWRKIHLGVALGSAYAAAAIVGLGCLATGQFELEHGIKALQGMLMFPAIASWPLFAIGCGLYNSKSIRKYMVLGCALLIVSVVTGCVMGYAFSDVLMLMSLLWTALALVAAWIEQAIRSARGTGGTRSSSDSTYIPTSSSSSSDSGSGWFSSSSSDSGGSSDSGWSGGDGGDSGGGGASDSW